MAALPGEARKSTAKPNRSQSNKRVGNQTGQARMVAGDNPDAGISSTCRMAVIRGCRRGDHNRRLLRIKWASAWPGDLIKADAEADLDVLFGAEKQISKHAPQLAITTYHVDDHAERMIEWLRQIRPDYKLRKGSFWTTRPRPVLLQASTL